jgi:hypothetical protein
MLLSLLSQEDNLKSMDIKSLVQRNASKLEYWWLLYILIKKKFISYVKIDMGQLIEVVTGRLEDIRLSADWYLRLDPSLLLLLAGVRCSNLEHDDLVQYIKIKHLIK